MKDAKWKHQNARAHSIYTHEQLSDWAWLRGYDSWSDVPADEIRQMMDDSSYMDSLVEIADDLSIPDPEMATNEEDWDLADFGTADPEVMAALYGQSFDHLCESM